MTKDHPPYHAPPVFAWLFFVLAMLTLIPVGFGAMIALGAGEPPWRPYAWRVWVVVAVCAFAGVGAVASSVRRILGKPLALGGLAPVGAGLLAAACPALAWAVLPWEEPGTGSGSPLAVLIGLACMAIPAIAYLALATLVAVKLRGTGSHELDEDQLP